MKPIGPEVILWAEGFPLDATIARLSTVPSRVVVRITGGCGYMCKADTIGVTQLFTEAFKGFDGCMLIGGTRMLDATNPQQIIFGITEIGPAIRRLNPRCFVLGVVPQTRRLQTTTQGHIVVRQAQSEPNNAYTTIIHPDQDEVIAVLGNSPREIWDDEMLFCNNLKGTLVDYGGWRSLLVAYNGGSVTEREIRMTAARNEPVLLVQGSGRVCDQLAQDAAFMREHPSVVTCEKDPASLRASLIRLGVITSKEHVS